MGDLWGIGRACLLAVALALAGASPFPSAEARTGETDIKRVVILNATDPYLPAFLVLDQAQRTAINAGNRDAVEFYAENLDMHRFPRKLLDQDLVALLHWCWPTCFKMQQKQSVQVKRSAGRFLSLAAKPVPGKCK